MLSQQQIGFTLDVFREVPSGQAYMNHYSVKSMAVADVCASKLLRSAKIQDYLQELRSEIKTEAIADVQERQEVLTEILRGRFGDFADAKGHLDIPDRDALNNASLQEVKTTHFIGGKDGRASETTTTIKLRDPITAIQELNRMTHVYEERVQAPGMVVTFVFILPDGTRLHHLKPKEIEGDNDVNR